MENKNIKNIAKILTDDPDIFNEMAAGTGAIAMGPMQPLKTRKKKKRKIGEDESEDPSTQKHKKYYADPVTGQPEDGEILYSDTQSESEEHGEVDSANGHTTALETLADGLSTLVSTLEDVERYHGEGFDVAQRDVDQLLAIAEAALKVSQ